MEVCYFLYFFFFQAEDGIRDLYVTGVQTCALPIARRAPGTRRPRRGRDAVGAVAHLARRVRRARRDPGRRRGRRGGQRRTPAAPPHPPVGTPSRTARGKRLAGL